MGESTLLIDILPELGPSPLVSTQLRCLQSSDNKRAGSESSSSGWLILVSDYFVLQRGIARLWLRYLKLGGTSTNYQLPAVRVLAETLRSNAGFVAASLVVTGRFVEHSRFGPLLRPVSGSQRTSHGRVDLAFLGHVLPSYLL